jgi:hypothetical protein
VDKDVSWAAIKTTIDSPSIYMLESINQSFLKGNILNKKMAFSEIEGVKFMGSTPLSSSSIALRVYDSDLEQSYLKKIRIDSPRVNLISFTLEKQVDGLFSSDGVISYDPVSARLIYLYYYRNEFICLDTNFNFIYKGRTIDTTTVAKIRVAKFSSGEQTLSVPGELVNKKFCISGDWIFIQSGLKANNESEESFSKFYAIDVYNLDNGKYKFSFYLPDHKGKKLRDFKVYKKRLAAIYENELLTFSLNF